MTYLLDNADHFTENPADDRSAAHEFADVYGAEHPERCWINTPADVWVRNPHYTGPFVHHPEADEDQRREVDAVRGVGREFITAGKAIFTVDNGRGKHHTFRVTHKPGSAEWAPAWFVSLLTWPDNTSDYTYLGLLDAETGAVRLTAKSKYRDDTEAVRVIRWALRLLWTGADLPVGYSIHHAGRCGRCGRMLTTPESVERGIGPECATKLGE